MRFAIQHPKSSYFALLSIFKGTVGQSTPYGPFPIVKGTIKDTIAYKMGICTCSSSQKPSVNKSIASKIQHQVKSSYMLKAHHWWMITQDFSNRTKKWHISSNLRNKLRTLMYWKELSKAAWKTIHGKRIIPSKGLSKKGSNIKFEPQVHVCPLTKPMWNSSNSQGYSLEARNYVNENKPINLFNSTSSITLHINKP